MEHVTPRILFLLNPAGIMDHDLVAVMEHLGLTFVVENITLARTPEGHSAELIDSGRMTSLLDEFRPDVVLSLNGRGVDNEGCLAGEFARRRIPYASWYVDRPRPSDQGGRYDRRHSCLFCFDRSHVSILEAEGFDHVHYLPLAANHLRFRPLDIPEESRVCFVGGSDYARIRYLAQNLDRHLEGADVRFYEAVEQAILAQLEAPGVQTGLLVDEALGGAGMEVPGGVFRDLLEGFVEREASLRLRLGGIERLERRLGFTVYGDELWKNVVADYRGRADYRTDEIVEVYNRYALQVNISRFQLHTAINQRPFDVSACGHMVLTDERECLRELFAPDEMVSWRDLDDLEEKADYYLQHPQQRQKLAERARTRVLREHTYVHRLRTLLNTVEKMRKTAW